MATADLTPASTVELRDLLVSGALSAVDYAQSCIDRITAREADVQAWTWFDSAYVLAQAEQLDALRDTGAPLGPLHGLPIGIKDVIDTKDIPTENGCPLDAGRIPDDDAEVVQRLKAAGAIVFGKTVTTELAFLHPGKTRNPHDLARTPGGSSSGSAAAVADGMVPLAIGTQTGGSVIRPASFCGVVGFKPTFGTISRQGVLLQSQSLDTVGVFARDLAGAALLISALRAKATGVSGSDLNCADTSADPLFAFVKPPGWADADPALHKAFEGFADALGSKVIEASLPAIFDEVAHHRAQINNAEMGYHFRHYLESDADALGPQTRAAIEEGHGLLAESYIAALEVQNGLVPSLAQLFERCDAILCPAAPGPAPNGLASTGDSIFNGLWTMAGVPAITLPLLTSPDNMPIGVQLVGASGKDVELAQTARWLSNWYQSRQA